MGQRILLGNKCNNNCWSCSHKAERDRGIEEIKEEAGKLDKKRPVVITGGEPTIQSYFWDLLEHLQQSFPAIQVLSNARAFYYRLNAARIASYKNVETIVKILGHTRTLHDSLTRTKGSFEETIAGMRNLADQGARYSCQIEVTEQNFSMTDRMISLVRATPKIIISFPTHGKNYEKTAVPFHESCTAVQKTQGTNVFFQGIPMCFTSGSTVYNPTNHKSNKCRSCRQNGLCNGVTEQYLEMFTDEFLKPEPDLPKEVAIEITTECNLSCEFCFKKNISYCKKELTLGEFESIAKKIPAGVDHIRITGGEPLMHSQFENMLKAAKNAGLKIWLNTNATLINKKNAEIIACHVENVLVPIAAPDREKEKAITGMDSHESRISGIQMLKSQGVNTVRCGTVATKQNIKDLEKIYSLALKLGLSDWEIYRQMPTPENPEPTDKADIDILLGKLHNLNKIFKKNYRVANGLPFCAVRISHMAELCAGAIADDGHMRIVIGPDGKARPSYFLDEKVGDIFNQSVEEIWNSKFMKSMRNLEFAPQECRDCLHIIRCKGGSRFAAKKISGSYTSKDPLADFCNIIN